MKYLSLILSIFICNLSLEAQYEWLGGNGDYDDPTMWNSGAVPGPEDDVFIDNGTVIFPSGGIYEAKDFITGGSCTLDFKGFLGSSARIHIYGSVKFDPSTNVIYEADSYSTWEFKGSGINHNVSTGIIDLLAVYLDDEDSQIELASPMVSTQSFYLKKGHLDTNGHDVSTGTFRAGGSCNGSNCTTKTLNLNGSIITCSVIWDASFNYGSLNINGSYTIRAPQFDGGANISYDKVILTDYEPQIFGFVDMNLYSTDNSFNVLEIDNIYLTKIAGNITVSSAFNVIQPNGLIFITKEGNGSTEQWSLNGSVNLPIDQGGCYDFTRFSRHFGVDSDFNFHTTNSNLIFDYAIIEGIPTSGGGTFTVKNGHIAGFNTDWSLIQDLSTKTLYWVGGTGEWNDGNHWAFSTGGQAVGCSPSIIDHAVFDANSFSASGQAVSIKLGEFQSCKNFQWTSNPHNASFEDINSPPGTHPYLYITGSVDIDVPNIFDFEQSGLIFMSNDEASISSESDIPSSQFISESSYYLFGSDLTFRSMSVIAGGIDTEGYNLDITYGLVCKTFQPKYFNLNNSQILAGSAVIFGNLFNGNTIVDAGNSYINCTSFSSVDNDFNIVEINNTSENLIVADLFFKKLILNGSSIKLTQAGLHVDSLIINSNNADIILLHNATSKVNKAILSYASSNNPPEIRSSDAYQKNIEFIPHNICIIGPIEFNNINAISTGSVNAEEGVDGGGNSGFNFAPPPGYSGSLYWTGADGFFHELTNWSNGSGGCPTSIDPTAAQTLVFDDISFSTSIDTVRIPNQMTVGALSFTNSNFLANFKMGNSLFIKEMEIDGGFLYQKSTNGFSGIIADHHIHVKNGGTYYVVSSNTSVGSKPSTLSETSFHIQGNSGFFALFSGLYLRGHTTNQFQPTLKFDSDTTIGVSNFDVITSAPESEEPIRDMYIEGKNVQLENLILSMADGQTHDVFINENLRAKSVQMSTDNGNLIIKPGVTLMVND